MVYGSTNHKRKAKTDGNSTKRKKQNRSTSLLKKTPTKNVTQKPLTMGRKRKGRIIKNSGSNKNLRKNSTRKKQEKQVCESQQLQINEEENTKILQNVTSMEQMHVPDNYFVNTIIKEEPEYDEYGEEQSVIENLNSIFDDDIDIKEDKISQPDEEVDETFNEGGEKTNPRVFLQRLALSDNVKKQVDSMTNMRPFLAPTNIPVDNLSNADSESSCNDDEYASDDSQNLVPERDSFKDTVSLADILNIKITCNSENATETYVSLPVKNTSNWANQLHNKSNDIVMRFDSIFQKKKQSWNIPIDLRKENLHTINSKDKIFPNALLGKTDLAISDDTVDAGVSESNSVLSLSMTFANNYASDIETSDKETNENVKQVSPTSDLQRNRKVIATKLKTISIENRCVTSPTPITSDNSGVDNISNKTSSEHSDIESSKSSTASSPKKNLDESDPVNSPKRIPQFKVPFLPPAKRPPARTKIQKESQPLQTNLLATLLSNNGDTIQSHFNSDNEDAISLGISSLPSIDFEDNLSVDGESSLIRSPAPNNELETNQFESHTFIDAESQKKVMQWMSNLAPEAPKERPAFPLIFKTLCLNYFSRGCNYRGCFRKHVIPNYIKHSIQQLPYNKLIEAYTFMTQKHKLYEALFNYFAKAFEQLRCSNQLLNCVNDILKTVCSNKTPFIETTVNCLLHLDIPFQQIIDEIFNSNKTTIDILLEIIFSHHKNVLCTDWYIVQNLLKYKRDNSRTQQSYTPVDHGLVEEIMIACCNDKNLRLAQNIVKDIIEPEQPPLVDLKLISSSTLNNMLSILNTETCNEKRMLIDRMKRLNITIVSLIVTDRENSTKTVHQMQYNTAHPVTTNLSNIAKDASTVNYSNSGIQLDTFNQSFTNNLPTSYDEEFEECWNEGSQGRTAARDQSKSPNSPLSRSFSYTNSEYSYNFEVDFDNSTDYQTNSYKDNQPHPYPQDYTFMPPETPFSINNSCVSSEAGVPNVKFYNNPRHPDIHEPPVMTGDPHLNRDLENMTEYDPEMLQGRLSGLSQNSEKNDFINWQPQVEVLQENETLTEIDMTSLKNAIDNGNRCDFLAQFLKFKDSPLKRAFVLNTLVFLKSKTAMDVYEMIYQLICGFEQFDPNYFTRDKNIKNVLEMLSINAIAILENHKSYENAGNILLKFQCDLNSLVKTTWFSGPHRHDYSEAGKYIYFCKIFVKGGFFNEAWQIIAAPELKLLYGTELWSPKRKDMFDKKFKNFVLKDLLDMSLETDIKFLKFILLHMLDNNNISTDIDLWYYFNTMLVKMLQNKEDYMDELTQLVKRVTNGWYKSLSPSVMRGLFICLAIELADSNIEFYDTCCKKNIYPVLRGDEKFLLLKTDMSEEEIYMILHVYLTKKIRNNISLTDLSLILRDPSQLIEYHPTTLLSPKIGVQDLRLRVLRVLTGGFCSIIHVEYKAEDHKIINIRKQYLRYVYEDYRRLLSEF